MSSPAPEREATISRQFAASRRSSSPPAQAWSPRSNLDDPHASRSPAPARRSWSRSRTPSPRRARSISRSNGSLSPGSSPGSGGRGGYQGKQFRDPPRNWRGPADRNADLCTVYVGGLPYDTQQEDIYSHFGKYGEVIKVRMIKDHETQEFRGFGFVTFRSPFAAEDAAEDANGTEVLGGRVKVNIAKYKGTLRPAYRDERAHPYDGAGDYGAHHASHPHAHAPMHRGPPRQLSPGYGSPRGSPRGSPSRQRSHRPPSPKRRRRSSEYEARHNGDSSAHELVEGELRKAKDELKAVQAEREQVQRECKDVKQQLDELTVQANSKLSDQRSKIKVSKRRSMLRGKQLMGLVDAAKQVKMCQDAVEQAEKALGEAKANLVVVLSQAQDYVTSEQAEDEASDRERAAEHEAKQRAEIGTGATNSATRPSSAHSTPVAPVGNSGFALKPFKISLDPS